MAFYHPNSIDDDRPKGMGFCAVRKRKSDGTPNVGGRWLEPLGSSNTFFEEGLDVWEVVYHDGQGLPE